MKHGLKLRKLQRTPSHRWALLRNLVSALLHHESIKTTLPKAKETARLAEKIITLGKRGTDPAYRAATAFLMPSHSYQSTSKSESQKAPLKPIGYPSSPSSSSFFASSSSSSASSSSQQHSDPNHLESFEPPTSLLPKLFNTLSQRYATRSGGYTRIHKFGKRPGDNADQAILELVDGPKDLKFEMTARAVGKETLSHALSSGLSRHSLGNLEGMESENFEGLREGTRLNVGKVLRYRSEEEKKVFEQKAKEWADGLLAEERASGGHRRFTKDYDSRTRSEAARLPSPFEGRRHNAGERMSGMKTSQTGLGLARGDLSKRLRFSEMTRRPKFLNERTI